MGRRKSNPKGVVSVTHCRHTIRTTPRWKLRQLNEKLALENRTLHPTKGYRTISAAKSVASLITDQMKQGHGWWPLARIRFEIRRALKDDARTANRKLEVLAASARSLKSPDPA
jgi:hypothetical protein